MTNQTLNEALTTAARLGRISDGAELAVAAQQAAAPSYQGIGQQHFTENRKQQLRAKSSTTHVANLTTQLVAVAKQAQARAAADMAKITGNASLTGDPNAIAQNRRAADDRIATITDHTELARIQATAEQQGDQATLLSINARAFELRDADLLNAYAEGRGADVEAAMERAWADTGPVDSATKAAMLGVAGVITQLTPPELSGMSEYQIAALAEQADQPAVPAADPVRGGW